MFKRLIIGVVCALTTVQAQAESCMSGREPGKGVLVSGVGHSLNKDVVAAAKEATEMALKQLNGTPTKLALVFASYGKLTKPLIDTVAKLIPREKIIGAETASPLVNSTNFAFEGNYGRDHANSVVGTAVLLIGGDIHVSTAFEPLTEAKIQKTSVEDNAKLIGEKFKSSLNNDLKGHFVFTFGYQPYKRGNIEYAKALTKVFGRNIPILGGSSGNKPNKRHVVYQGKIHEQGNVAALVSGDFSIKTSLASGKTYNETEKALDVVTTRSEEKASLLLVSNCAGRRNLMHKNKQLEQEAKIIAEKSGSIPLFGLYASGEIGSESVEQAAKGVGYSCCILAVY